MGQKYEHFRGGLYEYVGVARHVDHLSDEQVVYRSLHPSRHELWVRRASEFFDYVEVPNPVIPGGKPIHVPRFREITDDEYLDLLGSKS